MSRTIPLFVTLLALAACKDEPKPAGPDWLPKTLRPGAPAAPGAAAQDGSAAAAAGLGAGPVLETMDAGEYTYVRVDVGGGRTVWAAGPATPVKVGDRLTLPSGMPMQNFESKTLHRTFDVVYFVGSLGVGGAAPAGTAPSAAADAAEAAPNPHAGAGSAAAQVDLSGINKAPGGRTVAEVYGQKDVLAGKEVVLRARVVKYTGGVMGKNWLHVRDGSGSEGTNDLTITTTSTAAVGNTVLVRGVVGRSKDFGFGYAYDVIVEDAQVTVEQAL